MVPKRKTAYADLLLYEAYPDAKQDPPPDPKAEGTRLRLVLLDLGHYSLLHGGLVKKRPGVFGFI